jgi:hypothetical protein
MGEVYRADDPPLNVSGMVTVTLDARGRLRSFVVVPGQIRSGARPAGPPSWEALFAAPGQTPVPVDPFALAGIGGLVAYMTTSVAGGFVMIFMMAASLFFGRLVLRKAPLAPDLSRWFAGYGLFCLAIVLAVAAYGFWAARGGAVFSGSTADD